MRNSLRALEGVRHVEVDLEDKQATVIYTTAVIKTSTMTEATTNIGFPSSVKKTESH